MLQHKHKNRRRSRHQDDHSGALQKAADVVESTIGSSRDLAKHLSGGKSIKKR